MSYTATFESFSSEEHSVSWSTRTFGDGIRKRYSTGWHCSLGPLKPLELKPKGTKYDEIKVKCLKDGRLFEDPDFDAVDSVLFYVKPPENPSDQYVWRRPKEIQELLGSSATPEFFVDGASQFDIQQNKLGDCWMLAAMSCLSMRPELMRKVVPDDQNFKDGEYAGIFRFNLWSFGKWVEVIIDDRLPTTDMGLAYTGSSQQNEFWTALLEKAFAKLYGSYKALNGGRAIEALEDYTGGIGEVFMMGSAPTNLWTIMLKAYERDSLMSCFTHAEATQENHLANGLITGHAYSVTGVKLVTTQKFCNLQMLRIRNPWGGAAEWNGDWSDKSPLWNEISESEKEQFGHVSKEDGEFWMSFNDCVKNFMGLDICHLDPGSFKDDADALKKKRWATTCFEGSWKRGLSAGGDVKSPTVWMNPQYRFEVVDVDEGDGKDAGTVIIGLMQKDRQTRAVIGYTIYELSNSASAPLDKNFDFRQYINRPRAAAEAREICGRHELRPGSYCVVPFTKFADQEGDFILRIFTEKPMNSKELDEPTGIMDRRPDVKPSSEDLKKGQEMWKEFQKISGENFQMDAYELQDILNAEFMKEFKFDGFSSETCRSLVALKDVDRSGKLGCSEFVELWILLQRWTAAFKNLDKDGSGTIDSYELRHAMHDIGYTVSNQTFSALVMACSHKDRKIHFDKFIRAMARLSTMIEVHNEMSHGRGDSNALFNLDQFIQTTMYS